MSSFYGFSLPKLGGGGVEEMKKYEGNVCLVVNVASLWGLTKSNYAQLNDLQEEYGKRGLQVLGVPCNQFGMQEPSEEAEIMSMLKHVRPGNGFEPKFPIYGKVEVNGERAHEAFTYLKEGADLRGPMPEGTRNYVSQTSARDIRVTPVDGKGKDVRWNFEKFLVGREGSVLGRFAHTKEPKDKDITAEIEKALGNKKQKQ